MSEDNSKEDNVEKNVVSEKKSDKTKEGENKTKPPLTRLLSLDAFRGLTIFGMLLVNNIALDDAVPAHLTHARWNQGVNFADMVFPWFLFIVGVAIPYSYSSHFKKGFSRFNYVMKAFSRMVSLLFLGCLIDSSVVKSPVLGLGVLQLIGMAYFVTALLYGLPGLWRIFIAVLFLVGHWAFIRFFPFPGMEPGVFTETSNVINYINQIYLEPIHLKGLISVIPTSALVLIGTGVGDILRNKNISDKKKVIFIITGSLILVLAGWIWNFDLPFNKPVWTASYILYTAGCGAFILAVFYLIIDIIGFNRWCFPLVVFGVNPILAYMMPIMVKLHILQEWMLRSPGGNSLSLYDAYLQFCIVQYDRIWGGWAYTISYIFFWWFVMLYFYYKKIFLKV